MLTTFATSNNSTSKLRIKCHCFKMYPLAASPLAFCRVDSTEVIEKQLKRKRVVVSDAAADRPSFYPLNWSAGVVKKTRYSRSAACAAKKATAATASSAPAKRSVSFSETLQVIPAPAFAYDSSITPTRWYRRQDYAAFKATIKQDVMHMALLCHSDSLRKLDFSEHSVVGIEKYCRAAKEQISAKQAQKQLVQAVLDQQALQKVLNLKDEETMRLTSLVYTQQGTLLALQRAKAFM
jgi:hypothetical protein